MVSLQCHDDVVVKASCAALAVDRLRSGVTEAEQRRVARAVAACAPGEAVLPHHVLHVADGFEVPFACADAPRRHAPCCTLCASCSRLYDNAIVSVWLSSVAVTPAACRHAYVRRRSKCFGRWAIAHTRAASETLAAQRVCHVELDGSLHRPGSLCGEHREAKPKTKT